MFEWKNLVKTVAPLLGTALGGPLAGAATKFIADKFLGSPDATEEDISKALAFASPEQLVKLKELDNSFALEMKKLDIDLYNIDYLDRNSARDREKTIKDWTPSILAYGIAIGFFATVWKLLSDGTLSDSEQVILNTMSNLLMLALSYYFGSSNKDRLK
jgi:hypothetical protein